MSIIIKFSSNLFSKRFTSISSIRCQLDLVDNYQMHLYSRLFMFIYIYMPVMQTIPPFLRWSIKNSCYSGSTVLLLILILFEKRFKGSTAICKHFRSPSLQTSTIFFLSKIFLFFDRRIPATVLTIFTTKVQ